MSETSITDQERKLLKKYRDFYEQLDEGQRVPTTKAQQHFVEVCRGEAEPENDHEVAYMKFKRGERVARLKSGRATGDQESVEPNQEEKQTPGHDPEEKEPSEPPADTERVDSIPEYEEGYPNPNWYPGRDRSRLNPYSRRPPWK